MRSGPCAIPKCWSDRPIARGYSLSISPQMGVSRWPMHSSGAQTRRRKMPGAESVKFDVNEEGVALLLGELDHRMRNLLMMIEAIVRQTESTSIEDYRA